MQCVLSTSKILNQYPTSFTVYMYISILCCMCTINYQYEEMKHKLTNIIYHYDYF